MKVEVVTNCQQPNETHATENSAHVYTPPSSRRGAFHTRLILRGYWGGGGWREGVGSGLQ